LTLNGAGAGGTFLQPDGAHRAVLIEGGIVKGVTLSNLTIQKGNGDANGASVYSGAGTPLTLSRVQVRTNSSNSSGGGIFVEGPLTTVGLLLNSNGAPGGAGGGLRALSTVSITGGTIENNMSFNPGGAMRSERDVVHICSARPRLVDCVHRPV
jgi:hypothetical protein